MISIFNDSDTIYNTNNTKIDKVFTSEIQGELWDEVNRVRNLPIILNVNLRRKTNLN